MYAIQKQIADVRRFLAEKKIAPSKLAKMSKLHANALRDVWASEWNPNANTLIALANSIAQYKDSSPPLDDSKFPKKRNTNSRRTLSENHLQRKVNA